MMRIFFFCLPLDPHKVDILALCAKFRFVLGHVGARLSLIHIFLDGHNVNSGIFVIIGIKNGVIQLNELLFFVKDGDKNGVLVVSFQFCSSLLLKV